MQSVDYDNPLLMPAPRRNRPNRRETMYLCTCSRCGNARYLTAQNAESAAAKDVCRICASRVAGKKGFAALVEKYGEEWAMKHLREYRLANPSSCEQVVIRLLDKEGISYRREFPIKTEDGVIFYDFVFDNVLVEVDGAYWHNKPEQQKRDAYKDALALANGYIIVRIKEERLKDAQSLIYAALQDARYLAF